MNAHDFKADLVRSYAQENASYWDAIYRDLFPGMAAYIRHSQDGDHQRLGVDTTIIMKNSKTYTIDEKIRLQDFPDILCEEWSDVERKIPGWLTKPLLCDFILYLNIPGGKVYLLPTLQLQSAWRRHGEEWKRTRKPKPAHNRDLKTGRQWTSINWALGYEELYPRIGACLRATLIHELGATSAPSQNVAIEPHNGARPQETDV